VATIVGVAVGKPESVGRVSLGGGRGVAVETRGGVGTCGEQEMSRTTQKAESKMRVVTRGSMKGILTELSTNNVSRINEKTSRVVPEINFISLFIHEYVLTKECQFACVCGDM
jgi:hypothetical protein